MRVAGLCVITEADQYSQDGIEPPTAGLFQGRELEWARFAHKALERGFRFIGYLKVVARDGIEPPTPAFSGPRSTTELSGLRENCWVRFCARDPASPEMVGESQETLRSKQPQTV